MRPILPGNSRLEAGAVPYDIGAVKRASIGGPADDVPLGLSQSVGTIAGRWGFGGAPGSPRRAMPWLADSGWVRERRSALVMGTPSSQIARPLPTTMRNRIRSAARFSFVLIHR